MKPRFRGDVFFTPSADGVSFSGMGANGQLDRFSLKGRMLYQAAVFLSSRLDGKQELDDFLKSLSPIQRPMLNQLIPVLIEHGFIRDAGQDEPERLTELEQNLFAKQISYIDCYKPTPRQAFEKFRYAKVGVIGSGWTVAALAQNLWENGLANLDWVADATPNPEADQAELQARLKKLPAASASLNILPELPTSLAGYDIWLYAADTVDLPLLTHLSRLCRAAGVAFYPAFFQHERGFAGGLELPGENGCWNCSGALQTGSTSVKAGQFFSPVAATLLGNTLAFRVFSYFTTFAGAENRSLYSFSLETLDQRDTKIEWQTECALCRPVLQENKTLVEV